ncbi:hypothetical protein I3843_13G050700 [Carya illinoinensis]|uniref:Uncharacterized protein n=1 Tax=Carya illinoinensis TaxID=32201 RepID=A0A922AKK0_CARIL|nr:hypothetical protein I3760_13G058200 [Carya illinoinensis]KAG6680761.1 hypothetical protein I3842_13G059200 [Carya illinoinensis]KAG7949222.1 hypothetical protein I3843_13G050700 [Carya illinoinensis]
MVKQMLLQLLLPLASRPGCFITRTSRPRGLRPISSTKMSSESYTFGPYKIPHEEVFYSSQLSYAMVNLRPVVPGIFLSPPLLLAF